MGDSQSYVVKSSIKTGQTGTYATILFDLVYNAKSAETYQGFKLRSASAKVKAYCSDGSGTESNYVIFTQHNLTGQRRPVDWERKIESFSKPPAGLGANVYRAVCDYAKKNGIYQDVFYVSPEEKNESARIAQQNQRFCDIDTVRIYDSVHNQLANAAGAHPRAITFEKMAWDARSKSCYSTIGTPRGVAVCETWIDKDRHIFRLDCGSGLQFCSGSCNANGR